MPRRIAPLSETKIRNCKPAEKDYKLADGYGLYLLVTSTGGKLWRFKYRIGGKEKLISLGAYPEVGLADARDRRTEARRLVESGIDPSQHKKASRHLSHGDNTFKSVALAWHAYNQQAWSKKHSDRLIGRLNKYLFPIRFASLRCAVLGKKILRSLLVLVVLIHGGQRGVAAKLRGGDLAGL